VIENLSITLPPLSTSPAIAVHGFRGVTIRNVLIEFGPGSRGILFSSADGIVIDGVSIKLVGAANATGPLPSSSAVAISGSSSTAVNISRVRAEGTSSGVYLVGCPAAHVSQLEAHNMRG
jgi:hypothetical protein